eukprot:comp11395_c0_seq1/m.5766 comp11395_c0_seq1/g.5766  ORF comp11395_c0_seq1/g.5766 comp11395_c0_seq1/m.5766 type:complete len:125 (-) comp11395_c0_seq1:536-910(-)
MYVHSCKAHCGRTSQPTFSFFNDHMSTPLHTLTKAKFASQLTAKMFSTLQTLAPSLSDRLHLSTLHTLLASSSRLRVAQDANVLSSVNIANDVDVNQHIGESQSRENSNMDYYLELSLPFCLHF